MNYLKRCSALLSGAVFSTLAFGQLEDQKTVTLTMDLQPVLELKMETTNNLDFIFDDIQDYIGGISHYAATVLEVSSTVNWVLYAVGRSNTGNRFFQQITAYGDGASGGGSTSDIPMSAVELRQTPQNDTTPATPPGGTLNGRANDYSAQFSQPGAAATASNSLFVNNDGSITRPTVNGKYIAGHFASTISVPGGTYLVQGARTYRYVIDYRILPSLPVIFPNATDATQTSFESLATGTYAQPGVYNMYVQYVLQENQ